MNLVELIPMGKENAITRNRLCELTGLSDRKVRMAIHDARTDGVMIISSTGQSGYFMPETRADVEKFIKQQKSYIRNLQKSVSRAEKELKNFPLQQSIF